MWNRALVTGASSGIGREIARQLAATGTELVLVARDRYRLEALAAELPVKSSVLVADLAADEGVDRVVERISDAESPVDLLVNNAGFGFSGSFPELDGDAEAAVVQVNVVALHRLCHAAAVAMKPRGHGGILNISSLASSMIAADSATYCATKHFVTALSEALHVDLARYGIVVTAACPGFTRTEFSERAEVDLTHLPDFLWQEASDCAAESLAALNKGRARVITGSVNKATAPLLQVLPPVVMRKLAGTSNRLSRE